MNRYTSWPGLLIPVFGSGIAACVVALGVETDWGRALRPEPTLQAMKAAKTIDAALLPQFTLPSLDGGLTESAERPLFMPTRRPVPSASPAPRMKPGQFLLVGTSRTKEYGDSAMLKEIATNKTFTVKLGSTIQDMTLESVSADRVVLVLGEEKEELLMKARAQPRPAGAPAPQPGMPVQRAPGPTAAAAPMPGSGIFGGPTPVAATPAAPAAPIPPGAPGSPTVFPGAPGSALPNPGVAAQPVNPAAANPAGTNTNRPPTAEEILERRRRARALQAQQAQ
jgi:general secretion pathway protein N